MNDHLTEPWGLLDDFGEGGTGGAPAAVHAGLAPDVAPGADDASRRQREREALLDEAVRAARVAVQTIQATFDAGAADIDDAIKALGPLHRVLEAYERREASLKLGGAVSQAVLTIVLDGTPQEPPAGKRRRVADVIAL